MVSAVAAKKPPEKRLQSALSNKQRADRKLAQAQAASRAARVALQEACLEAAMLEVDAAEGHLRSVRDSLEKETGSGPTVAAVAPAPLDGVAAVYQMLLALNTPAAVAAASAGDNNSSSQLSRTTISRCNIKTRRNC